MTNKMSATLAPCIAVLSGIVFLTLIAASTGDAAGKPKAPDFQAMVMSKYGFDDTVQILKGAIEEQNLMVVHEIDVQKMLRMVGEQTKGMKQILFFHPRYMKRMRKLNPNGAIEAPLKILVMERPDGKVMLRYVKPTYLFGRYETMDEVGQDLQMTMEKIISSATK